MNRRGGILGSMGMDVLEQLRAQRAEERALAAARELPPIEGDTGNPEDYAVHLGYEPGLEPPMVDPTELYPGGLLKAGAMKAMMAAGMMKGAGRGSVGALGRIVPAKESLRNVIDSNFEVGRVIGDETVPIDSLVGGVGREVRDLKRVDALAEKMSGPDGYIERLIVDQDGNVIEGQHRLSALQKIGVSQVPITRVADDLAGINVAKAKEAVRAVGGIHPDNVNRTVANVAELLRKERSATAVREAYDLSPHERAALDAMSPLPMDEASRMARAKEMYPAEVFHGTHADVDAFDPDMVDVGVHVGTANQAVNRLKSLSNPFSHGRSHAFRSGANIMPLRANFGNSLEMDDVGNWKDSAILAQALEKKGIRVDGLTDEAVEVKSQFEHADDWLESPENRRNLDDLNAALRDAGYDSIKYKNQVENEYGNLTRLLPEAEKQRSLINSEITHIEGKGYARRPLPPEPNSPNMDAELKAFLDWKLEDALLPHEKERINELMSRYRAIGDDPKNYDDPYSHIILDPRNIRSRFAKFNPADADSADLLKARGGAVRARMRAGFR